MNILFIPVQNKIPLVVTLLNTEGRFIPVFSDLDLIRPFMESLAKQVEIEPRWNVLQIHQPNIFCFQLRTRGFRIMLDPDLVSRYKTRWKEMVLG